MDKNVNAVYFSATGVVAKVVKEIAGELSKDFNEYNKVRTTTVFFMYKILGVQK